MREIYVSLAILLIFISSITIGVIIANYKQERKYNFLNSFPYEMENKDNLWMNLTFRSSLALFCGISSVGSLLFFFVGSEYLISRILSLTIVLNSFLLVSLFIINMNNYKLHLINSILFMVLNVVSYFLLAYLPFRENFVFYPMWLMVVSIIIGLILLFILLLPSLKNWYILKKEEDDKYSRGKVFPLAVIEWLNIIAYVLIFIIMLIVFILK